MALICGDLGSQRVIFVRGLLGYRHVGALDDTCGSRGRSRAPSCAAAGASVVGPTCHFHAAVPALTALAGADYSGSPRLLLIFVFVVFSR